MNIVVDYNSKIPIYEQIVNEIEKLVIMEILKPNEQIPSIRELACTVNINPNTVKKAYDILENKRIIISKSTKGTFINTEVDQAKNDRIDKIIEDIEQLVNELEDYGLKRKDILKKMDTKKTPN